MSGRSQRMFNRTGMTALVTAEAAPVFGLKLT
jgi:hypothetical protein